MNTGTPISLQRRHRMGAETEKRFFRAADLINTNLIARPPWLHKILHATWYEDKVCGVDAVAETDHGFIPIQIKSSCRWVSRFEETHPDFSGVIQVVHPGEDAHHIATDCIILLWQYYRQRECCDYERA